MAAHQKKINLKLGIPHVFFKMLSLIKFDLLSKYLKSFILKPLVARRSAHTLSSRKTRVDIKWIVLMYLIVAQFMP